MGEGKGQSGLETSHGASRQGAFLSRVEPSPSRGDPVAAGGLSFWQRGMRRLLHTWFFLSRGMTLGVRAIALDERGQVFLVRHSYLPGWHLPGGGVEWGQSLQEALKRELAEEGHLEMLATPLLMGIYWNRHASRRDHVAVFVVPLVRQTAPRRANYEIAEAGFFPPDALPAGVTDGTRRRLAEWFDKVPAAERW